VKWTVGCRRRQDGAVSRARTVTEVVGEDGSRIGTGAGRSEAAVIVPRKRTDSLNLRLPSERWNSGKWVERW